MGKLSSIKAFTTPEDLADVCIQIGSVEVNLRYDKSKYTPQFESEVQKMAENGYPAGGLAKFLSNLIVSWDVTDEIDVEDDRGSIVTKEVPVLPNEETFSTWGAPVMRHLLDKINEARSPNRETSKPTKTF